MKYLPPLFACAAILFMPTLARAQFWPRFPQLVQQQVVPAEPLPPAEVLLANTSAETLLVEVHDLRTSGRGKTYRILPGTQQPVRLDRDAGGFLQRIYHVPRFGRLYEQVVSTPISPRVLYKVVVSAERVTYSYRDPKGISGAPEHDRVTPVSVGVFLIPPGVQLGDQVTLDVAREAIARGNPGAAATTPPPLPPLR